MRRIVLGLGAAIAVAALVAACGGSSDRFAQPSNVKRLGGIVGAQSAGTVQSYTPTGKIVADDGFRPWVNGFGFENYGNDAGPQNMTAAQVEDLFGRQVCARGTGPSCRLTPIAQQWMADENARMAGGHCMGFSVTSIEFFKNVRVPTDYGAKTTFKLPVQGNVSLQSLLAENWTFQDLPSVERKRVVGTPVAVLRALVQSLNSQNELYTLAIFKRDGSGGHAITPFAIEDKGNGKFAILVYDNNFPGVIRAIKVNATANTWRYIGGPDPSDTDEIYDGNARTESMFLLPTTPGITQQPCPFCSGATRAGANGGKSASSAGSVLPPSKQYEQLTLVGNPENHGHLVLHSKGRVTGFLNGRIVNQIPGVRVETTITSQNWRVAPEPTYLIPPKTEVAVQIDGSDLAKSDKERVDMIGPGVYQQVDDIVLKPGEKNFVFFRGGDTGLTYFTDPHRDQTPLLAGAVQEGKTQYAFATLAVGIKGGSALTMYVDKQDGQVALDTKGTKGNIAGTGYAVYVLSIVRESAAGDATWVAGKLLLEKGQLAVVDYRHAVAGKALPVAVGTPNGKITYQLAQPQK
jgi:hypothetical protein